MPLLVISILVFRAVAFKRFAIDSPKEIHFISQLSIHNHTPEVKIP